MDPAVAAWATFGVICVAAMVVARLFTLLRLPLVTGYLTMGVIAGPFVLDIITRTSLEHLHYVSEACLAFIAFSAGAELYLPELRPLGPLIAAQTMGIFLATFPLCTVVIYALSSTPLLAFMNALSSPCRGALAATGASIMVARSPASAIAIIKELDAHGPFASILLGITVMSDLFVMLSFTVTSTAASTLCDSEASTQAGAAIGMLLADLLAACILGYMIGMVLIWLTNVKKYPWLHFGIIPVGFGMFLGATTLSDWTSNNLSISIDLEPLLVGIIAGFVCINYSRHNGRFKKVIHVAAPYMFVSFFTFTGASLRLSVLAQAMGFGAILLIVRLFCIALGSAGGGWLMGQPAKYNTYMWMTLLSQAGISLGLARELAHSAPAPSWGPSFEAALIAVILLNQVIGPIPLRFAVKQVGELSTGHGAHHFDEEAHSNAAIIVGLTDEALHAAVGLLSANWHVVMVTANESHAVQARAAVASHFRDKEAAAAAARRPSALQVAMADRAAAAAARGSAGGSASCCARVSSCWVLQQQPQEPQPQPQLQPQHGPTPGSHGTTGSSISGDGLEKQSQRGVGHQNHNPSNDHIRTQSHSRAYGSKQEAHLLRHFTALALLPDSVPASRNPLLQGASLAGVPGIIATSASAARAVDSASKFASVVTPVTTDGAVPMADAPESSVASKESASTTFSHQNGFPYTPLLAAMQSVRNLRAVLLMLPTDVANAAACEVVRATLHADDLAVGGRSWTQGLSKRGALHDVRILMTVHEPTWAAVAVAQGTAPLHLASTLSVVLSKLVAAPFGPDFDISLLASQEINGKADLVKACQRSFVTSPPLGRPWLDSADPVPMSAPVPLATHVPAGGATSSIDADALSLLVRHIAADQAAKAAAVKELNKSAASWWLQLSHVWQDLPTWQDVARWLRPRKLSQARDRLRGGSSPRLNGAVGLPGLHHCPLDGADTAGLELPTVRVRQSPLYAVAPDTLPDITTHPESKHGPP